MRRKRKRKRNKKSGARTKFLAETDGYWRAGLRGLTDLAELGGEEAAVAPGERFEAEIEHAVS